MDWCFDCLGIIERDKNLRDKFWSRFNARFFSSIFFGKQVQDLEDLLEALFDKFNLILDSRKQLLNRLSSLKQVDQNMAQRASDCHLKYNMFKHNLTNLPKVSRNRRHNDWNELDENETIREEIKAALASMQGNVKCELCQINHVMNSYSVYLTDTNRIRLAQSRTDLDGENEDEVDTELTGAGDLEALIRMILPFARYSDDLKHGLEIGKAHVKLFELLKDEMRSIRQYWTCASNEIQAMDELAINRTRVRVLADGERNIFNQELIIEKSKLDFHLNQLVEYEKIISQNLSRKMSQLLFLQNSLKVKLY